MDFLGKQHHIFLIMPGCFLNVVEFSKYVGAITNDAQAGRKLGRFPKNLLKHIIHMFSVVRQIKNSF